MLRVLLAAVAVCVALPVNAATYDLHYSFQSTVMSLVDYIDPTHTVAPYQGLSVGTTYASSLSLTFDGANTAATHVTCLIGSTNCNGGSLDLVGSFDPKTGSIWTSLFTGSGLSIIDFSKNSNTIQLMSEFIGGALSFRAIDINVSNIVVSGLPPVVPLPASLPLLGFGLLGLGWLRRRG